MEWRNSSNADSNQPAELQFDYNCDTVYIRKGFKKHEAEKDGDFERPEHWSYQELKVDLEDYEYMRMLMEQESEITETQDATVDLASVTADNTTMIEELQTALAELGAAE